MKLFYGPRWADAAMYLKSLADGTPAPAVPAAGETAPFPIGTLCADLEVDIRSQREWLSLWDRQQRAAPTLRTHFAWLPVSMCSAWPAATNDPQHRPDAGIPVLLLNSMHDPATGIEWARHVASQLRHGRLLTYLGHGHGVIDRTDCTIATTTRYLVGLRLPPHGATCPAAA